MYCFFYMHMFVVSGRDGVRVEGELFLNFFLEVLWMMDMTKNRKDLRGNRLHNKLLMNMTRRHQRVEF